MKQFYKAEFRLTLHAGLRASLPLYATSILCFQRVETDRRLTSQGQTLPDGC